MTSNYSRHFKLHDPLLYQVLQSTGTITFQSSVTSFEDLVGVIVQQQLSEKAGDTIWQRFIKLFSGKKVTPETVLKLSDGQIRAA